MTDQPLTTAQIGTFIGDLLSDHLQHTPDDMPVMAFGDTLGDDPGVYVDSYAFQSPINLGEDTSNILLMLPNGQQFRIMVLAR